MSEKINEVKQINSFITKIVYTLPLVIFLNGEDHFTGKCLQDGASGDRILAHWKQFSGTLTPDICLDYCKYFKFAGLFWRDWCFCGNSLKRTEFRPTSDCNYKCDGDKTQTCGGDGNKINVYSNENPVKFDGQCIQDQGAPNRVLSAKKTSFNTMTIEWCLDFCKDYAYAGVQFSFECHCGDMLRTMTLLPDGDCNMKCSGDETQFCGGSLKLNIFTIDRKLRQAFKLMFHIIWPLYKVYAKEDPLYYFFG